MLRIISPAEAAQRGENDEDFIVNFYWRCCPMLERISEDIKNNCCGKLCSLRFTWSRPKNKTASAEEFLNKVLPAALDGARTLAGAEIRALHVEKVPGENNLFALAQFANGVVAELELNECLPLSMPDTCFIKANFTNGHITNQPIVGHFNEEGAILANDDSMQTLIFEQSETCGSVIEQMQTRFRMLAEKNEIPAGKQGADEIMRWIENALEDRKR
ncbi:MAG: hypothetical protein JXR78_04455 [Victivallales bacterium]|nr:hypothetical protein [Victivallales bacterium]